MNLMIRLKAVGLMVILALSLLLLSLLLLLTPALAQNPGQGPPPPPAPKSGDPPLHYKSQQGLMPPAYVLDPEAQPDLSAAAAPQITFLKPYTTRTVGSWPQVLAAADVTGDQLNDVAIGTDFYFDAANDRQLHLWPQTGGDIPTGTQRLAGGQNPSAMVMTDMNLDGRTDVAVALAGEDTLAIYAQVTTPTLTLALTQPLKLPLAGGPDALAVGDFNGDLRNDLAAIAPQAVAPGAGRIHFWGSSTANVSSLPVMLDYPTGGFDDLAVGDLDNDGDDDLVALRGAGYVTSSLVVYLQEAGAFPLSYTLTAETGGYLPHSLAVGDVTNDGLDDVVVTAGGNTPDAYLNVFPQSWTPPGLVTTPVTYPTYHLPSAVVVNDLNHDGREDVVMLNDGWRTLSLFTQTVTGSLAAYAVTDLPYVSYHRPDALAVADLNGNGGLDVGLVGYYHDLTLLFNTLDAPTSVISYPLEAAILPPGSMTVTVVATNATAVEVRLKGSPDSFGNWQPAAFVDGLWQISLTLPDEERAWWIEARAINAANHYQAPPARRRIQVQMRCYAVADNENLPGSPDRLMLIDKATAEATLIGSTGTRSIEAIASPPNSPLLYAANRGQLGLLNLVTGQFSPTSSVFGQGQGAQGKITFSDVDSLAFDPETGSFYGVHRRSRAGRKDILFQIDPATGTRIPDAFGSGIDYRLIDGPGLLADIDEITFDPLGQMYGASTQNRNNGLLVKIDKETGSAIVVGSFGVKNVEGLAFLSEGLLYATTGKNGPATTKNRLYTVNPETGTVTEIGLFSQQQDYEGIACPAIPLGASSLQPAPQVESLIINEGQVSSSGSTLTLTVSMIDSTSVPEARWILFQEYGYDPTSGQWQLAPAVPNQTGQWLEYDASANYPWTLQDSAGVKYIQAWAADGSGRLSRLPYQTPVNYLPPSAEVAQGQVHFYRYELQTGERLTARLTSTSGDADLYIWPVDYLDGWPAWTSNGASGVDEVSFVAPEAGVYQIEVHGYTAATYGLMVEVTPAVEGTTPTVIEHVNPNKTQPSQPTVPLENEPDLLEAAPPALPGQKIYLPALAR